MNAAPANLGSTTPLLETESVREGLAQGETSIAERVPQHEASAALSLPDTVASLSRRKKLIAAIRNSRAANKYRAFRYAMQEDWQEAPSRSRVAASRAGVLAVQAACKLKAGNLLSTTAAVEVTAATNNLLLGGLAAFGVGAVHALTANGIIDYGVTNNPRTVQAMRDEFPRSSELLISAIPGLQVTDTQPQSFNRRLLEHVRRSPFSYANHTAMIAIAGAAGLDQKERRRFRHAVSLETAAMGAAFSTAISGAVMGIEAFDPDLGAALQQGPTAALVVIGANYLLAGTQLTRAYRRQRQIAQPQEEAPYFYPDIASPDHSRLAPTDYLTRSGDYLVAA